MHNHFTTCTISLNLKFSFGFHAHIWNIRVDPEQSFIALELRDFQSKIASVTGINISSAGSPTSLLLAIDWWENLSALVNGKIVIQKFRDEKFPEPKGFKCYDPPTSKLILNEDLTNFSHLTLDSLIACEVLFDKIIYFKYSLNTLPPEKKEIQKSELFQLTASLREDKILYPQQYYEGNAHFNTIRTFVEKYSEELPVEAFEYLETPSFVMVSYYIRTAEKLKNYLLITRIDGHLEMIELMSSESAGIGKNTFLVVDNQLIFIKDKKEIRSYEL